MYLILEVISFAEYETNLKMKEMKESPVVLAAYWQLLFFKLNFFWLNFLKQVPQFSDMFLEQQNGPELRETFFRRIALELFIVSDKYLTDKLVFEYLLYNLDLYVNEEDFYATYPEHFSTWQKKPADNSKLFLMFCKIDNFYSMCATSETLKNLMTKYNLQKNVDQVIGFNNLIWNSFWMKFVVLFQVCRLGTVQNHQIF